MTIVMKLLGGLGNQMFQYAFGKAQSLRNKTIFKLDISEYSRYFRPYELEIFTIQKQYATSREVPFYEHWNFKNKYIAYPFDNYIKPGLTSLNLHHFKEKTFAFDKNFIVIEDGYIEGFFQTEKYFKDYEKEIRQDFSFITFPRGRNKEIIDEMEYGDAVSVHIRRGDYLKGNNPNYHGVCSLEYYRNAINFIKSKIKNPTFYFFSDDIERVKANLTSGKDIYIDYNQGKK